MLPAVGGLRAIWIWSKRKRPDKFENADKKSYGGFIYERILDSAQLAWNN